MSKVIKAQFAPVRISANHSITGLRLPDGLYGVYKSQAVEIVKPDIAPNQRGRQYIDVLKSKHGQRLAPEGFEIIKIKVEGLKSKAVDVFSVEDFHRFLRICDRLNYEIASEIIDDLSGLSLRQLFADAFGEKFEQEEREQWLNERCESKRLCREFANAIDEWIAGRVCSQPHNIYYSNAFNAINRGLFGKDAKTIRIELGINDGDLNRDHFGATALRWITQTQELAAKILQRNSSIQPCKAAQIALERMESQTLDYRI